MGKHCMNNRWGIVNGFIQHLLTKAALPKGYPPEIDLHHEAILVSNGWMVDRTGTVDDLVFKSAVPDEYLLRPSAAIPRDFKNIMLDRAKKYCDGDEVINVMWSGGVDSTAMVISFLLQEKIPREKIKLACNEVSIREHPNFYRKYIQPNFDVISIDRITTELVALRVPHILVMGEPFDTITGMNFQINYMRMYQSDHFQKPCTTDLVIEYCVKKGMKESSAAYWEDAWRRSFVASPRPIETMFDLAWWIGFNWRFIGGTEKFRLRFADLKDHFRLFGHGKEFEDWAILRSLPRDFDKGVYMIKRDIKEFILEFDGDQEYFDRKNKGYSTSWQFGSNPGRYCVKVMEPGDEIRVHTSRDFDLMKYYNPNNTAKKFLR